MEQKLLLMASNVSVSEDLAAQQSRVFLLISMRMFSTRPNKNGWGVTEGFIDEIVEHPDKYQGLPVYVDDRRLLAHMYNRLGHMFDREAGKFNTVQIGSMWSFEKVNDEYGVSLYGEARIPKREEEICDCLIELFNLGMLNFSFEIVYDPSHVTVDENDVTYIDAAAENTLTGMAIVTIPAYDEATALSLVAEASGTDEQDSEQKPDEREEQGVEKMTIEEALDLLNQKDQRINELNEQLAAAKAETQEALTGQASAQEEIKSKEESIASLNGEVEQGKVRVAELEAKVTECDAICTELETIKAEIAAAELKEKQDKAREFAQRQGLDAESADVASAIAELNYEKLVSLSMEVDKGGDDKEHTFAGYMGQGIRIDNPYDDLLASR